MLTWQVMLLVGCGLAGLLLLSEMLFYRLTDIYFQAKLDYMNRIMGGIGKMLTETTKRREERMNKQ